MLFHRILSPGLWLVSLLLIADLAWAAKDDQALGKQIFLQGNQQGAIACVSCHGQQAEGLAAAAYPQLAGLQAGYLIKQIQDYRIATRIHPVMQAIAKGLTESELTAVARYLASLPPRSSPPQETNAALLKRGEDIARTGLWNKNVPACFACHGPDGKGVGLNFPRISYQNKPYIVQQINAWKTGTRKNDPQGLMSTIARKLTNEETDAVATYLATMKTGGGT